MSLPSNPYTLKDDPSVGSSYDNPAMVYEMPQIQQKPTNGTDPERQKTDKDGKKGFPFTSIFAGFTIFLLMLAVILSIFIYVKPNATSDAVTPQVGTSSENKVEERVHNLCLDLKNGEHNFSGIYKITISALKEVEKSNEIIPQKPNATSATVTPQVGTSSENMCCSVDKMEKKVYKSCLDLKNGGHNVSGIYKITISALKEIEVYCDMMTSGGGWTLVASIVNENPEQICSIYDNWSHNTYHYYYGYTNGGGSSNWESVSYFGDVYTATFSDYKSRAYSSLKATDIMVTHVPNSGLMDDLGQVTLEQYYTSNKFLKNYGYKLSSMFLNHAKLQSLSIVGIDKVILEKLQKSLSISLLVPNWVGYHYDAGISANHIKDGGNFFNVGNKVYFSLDGVSYTLMNYGKTYTDSTTYHISSLAMQPFVTLASINTAYRRPSAFKLKVESTLSSNVSGSSHYVYARSTYKGVTYDAHGFQVYHRPSPHPSMCFVLFSIMPNAIWNSGHLYFNPTSNYKHPNLTFEMSLNTGAKNALVGYTLLTKRNDNSYTGFMMSDLDNFMKAIVDTIVNSDVKDLRNFHKPPPSLLTPVNIIKGNISYSHHSGVTPGYIQFRAYDTLGYPYAMCPGIKIDGKVDPAKFCIGSATTYYYNNRRCGDFAAWDSLDDHVFIDRLPNQKRFVNDLNTAILIFTRNDDEIKQNTK